MSTRTQGTLGPPVVERPEEITFVASYLDHWAREMPEATAITYIDHWADRHGVEHSVTFGELVAWSKAVAQRIMQITEPGDRVALLAPQSLEYGAGFTGAMRSHAVNVPLFAPDLPGQGDRLKAVVADCQPTAVMTTASKLDLVRDFCAEAGIAEEQIIVLDDLRSGPGHDQLVAEYSFPESLDLDSVAYLQYTSGSTRVPAGVVLTHGNLTENALQLKHGFELKFADATTVSWLPLFHDMGLVLGVAAPMLGGMHSVLLDPVAFVLKPVRWLQAVSGRRNVMTAAPNFAFDYVAKRVKDADREQLDLSGVVAWINGAEPVLPSTLDRFAERFAEQGVLREHVKPTYGLAEATVFVSTTPQGEDRAVIEVDSAQLQHGIAETDVAEGVRTTTLIASGIAVDQHLAVVDPDTRRLLPDGRVGEIWIQGPNVGVGYWQKPEQSEGLFNAGLDGDPAGLPLDGWLRTEDLGVLIDGRIFVTGRIKDLIIVDGRNIYPHDIEYTVEECHDAIAQRRLAAFSIPTESGEAMVVVAERYRHTPPGVGAELEEIARAASRAVSEEHAVALHDFVLVEPDTIARTSSGKIARKATRASYLDGGLQRTPAE